MYLKRLQKTALTRILQKMLRKGVLNTLASLPHVPAIILERAGVQLLDSLQGSRSGMSLLQSAEPG